LRASAPAWTRDAINAHIAHVERWHAAVLIDSGIRSATLA
jgi:hypothetical protein